MGGKRLSCMLLAGLFLVVPASMSRAADANPEALIEEHQCLMCHTLHGKGGGLAPPLEQIHTWSNPERVSSYIRDPKSVFPASTMPAFTLADPDLKALTDFIMGLK